jgi:hypothetical protein
MSVTDRLRQPEYIGENRCLACTAVNVTIAAGGSVLTAFASTVLGTGVFMFSLITIYLRGYLVPGTPALTKRYFPERVLRWFDKDTTPPITDESVAIDPEQVLLTVGAVEPCQDGPDLCLSPEFQQAWRERVRTVRAHGPDEDRLSNMFDILSGDTRTTIDQQDDTFIAYTDSVVIGQWGAQAAVIADIAPAEIARVLKSLRIFIEQCPECDGLVQVEQDAVESCCRSHDVVAATCQDCDVRPFEMEWAETIEDDIKEQLNQPVQTKG